MGAMLVYAVPFDLGDHNLFSIRRTLCYDFAARRRDKTLSPKLNSIAAGRCFMTDPIRGCDITAIRNRMTALNYLPSGMLCCTEFFLFAWMPADGCWVKNNLRAPQCRKPRRFRIPLVPANADADLSLRRFPCLKPQITRSEVKLFVVKGIVGNMHLAIFTEQFAVRVDNCGCVVIDAGAALLEK